MLTDINIVVPSQSVNDFSLDVYNTFSIAPLNKEDSFKAF